MPARSFLARFIPALLVILLLCASASAADNETDKFTLHENLHEGQVVSYSMTYDDVVKFTTTAGGKSTVTDTENGQNWKVTETVLSVQDGSARRARADVDKDSTDTSRTGNAKTITTTCPFAGKSIILTRDSDDYLSNNFPGDASSDDVNQLNDFLIPDAVFYPDQPVAVGEVWDSSKKWLPYINSGDRISSQCRLDWVRTIDGRQMGQISNVEAMIEHEDGNVEEDVQFTSTMLVDIAAGTIVQCDGSGSSTYSTPATEPSQKTGGTHFTFHSEIVPVPATEPTTQP